MAVEVGLQLRLDVDEHYRPRQKEAPGQPWTEPGTSSDARVGHPHALRRLSHGTLAPAIIARRRRRARVPECRFGSRQVHARVEQVARERAPAVTRERLK